MFVGLSDDNGLFTIETEMTLADIYTDYLEFATNPAQRLMMVYSSPFAACSYRVEVGYVLNKLNKLHQCECDVTLRRLSNSKDICQAGGIWLTTPFSWNLLQTP